jgi:hypothetical protein
VTKAVTNFAASVRARLLNDSKRRNGDFQLTLHRYVAERFLYRLGVSPHRGKFVLKGAMLFVLWDLTTARPTRDVDLAGYWANDAASLAEAFREICAISYERDGLEYRLDTMTVEPIRSADEYHGFRIQLDVVLARAIIPFQIDVGFGDHIVPEPMDTQYPTLLDGEAPNIRAYPREAVVAEKLHAMVAHGERNTRYKDFFDIFALSARYPFAGETLASAITATFTRRKVSKLEPWPVALTSGFYEDAARGEQWRRFLQRTKLVGEAPGDFALVGERMRAFLEAPLRATELGHVYMPAWQPGGPWQ